MATKTKTAALGFNPLSAADAFFDDSDPSPARRSEPSRRRTAARGRTAPRSKPPRPKKVRGTFQMDEDLLQRARNTVVALSGPPHRMTLAALVDQALTRELARLEKKHNDGDSFPETSSPLRQGRPIGS